MNAFRQHNNIIYTGLWVAGIVSGASLISIFNISNPGRIMQIKSISIDWAMRFAISNLNIPFENNTTQIFQLRCYHSAGEKIARMFLPIGGTAPINVGDEMRFTKPGQYLFDAFFVNNDLEFSLGITNLEAALAVNHIVSIMVETVEEPLQPKINI